MGFPFSNAKKKKGTGKIVTKGDIWFCEVCFHVIYPTTKSGHITVDHVYLIFNQLQKWCNQICSQWTGLNVFHKINANRIYEYVSEIVLQTSVSYQWQYLKTCQFVVLCKPNSSACKTLVKSLMQDYCLWKRQ